MSKTKLGRKCLFSYLTLTKGKVAKWPPNAWWTVRWCSCSCSAHLYCARMVVEEVLLLLVSCVWNTHGPALSLLFINGSGVAFEMKCNNFQLHSEQWSSFTSLWTWLKEKRGKSKVLISIATSLLKLPIFWWAPSTLRGWITQSARHPTDKFCRSVVDQNRTIRENSETNHDF